MVFPFAVSLLAAAEERTFVVRGKVTAPLEDGAVTVAHEEIPGFMPAMTMPFYIDPAAFAQAAPLRAGDRVEFKFSVGERSRAYDFVRLGPAGAEPASAAETAEAAPTRRLKEGSSVPDFALTDQQGRRFAAADLRGRRTVLTFIFTRCPVPEFCPRMSQRFQALQARLQKTPPAGAPVQLLSITIDPEFDTPEILRGYGESYGADPEHWRFATGTIEQIARLTKAFAVHTEKNAGTLDHTLTTALIDADGRVQTIWRGNGWKVDEVLAALGIAIDKS